MCSANERKANDEQANGSIKQSQEQVDGSKARRATE